MLCTVGVREGVDVRWARPEEARDLARLFLLASRGVAACLWSGDAAGVRPLEDVGAERYARRGGAFSYENCLVAVRHGAVAGMVHAYRYVAAPSAVDPVLRPYVELADPDALHVAGFAVYGRYREHGIGSRLIDTVLALALARALARVALLCFERDEPARRFLEKRGFREAARLPVVPHPCLHFRDGAVLRLVRDC